MGVDIIQGKTCILDSQKPNTAQRWFVMFPFISVTNLDDTKTIFDNQAKNLLLVDIHS
jgi:hypothetical protein